MRGLAITVVLAACSGSRVGPVRFANAPPVWRIDDRRDVATTPRPRPFLRYSYHFDSYYLRTVRGLALTRARRAVGVNSFDEVPDSTWFTNRVGIRDLTPDELRRGPGPDSPDRYLPWTIKSSKSGGTAVGFVVEDSRGVKFILKLDRLDRPEVESAADAIASRLLWASGFNVPADHVVYFKRGDVRLAPDAYTKVDGVKHPFDDKLLDARLAPGTGSDGRIRGIASIYIDGKVLGGTPRIGVRTDDPNDLLPHELRRDQRGQAPLMAWLANTDIKEDNTLDAWQADPANAAVHYVVHYLLDFGSALGAEPAVSDQLYVGYRYEIDPAATLGAILSLGLHREPWEDRVPSTIRGIGVYSDRLYDPGTWKPNTPAQLPVIWADRFDQFWGSKILIRFTRDQLAAAVDAARYSDPRAAPYMIDTLVARQRRTAQHWFRRVNPIDEFVVDRGRLCFVDLAQRHRLEPRAPRFTVSAFDASGRSLGGSRTVGADAAGRACIELALAPGGDRYTILRIESSRALATLVHVALDPAARPRVIGIHRL